MIFLCPISFKAICLADVSSFDEIGSVEFNLRKSKTSKISRSKLNKISNMKMIQ